MTNEEMTRIAEMICEMTPGEMGVFAGVLYDEIETAKTSQEVHEIYNALLDAGVDVTGICKKKRPQ